VTVGTEAKSIFSASLKTHEIVVNLIGLVQRKPKRAWKFMLSQTKSNTKNRRRSAIIVLQKYKSNATHSTENGITKVCQPNN